MAEDIKNNVTDNTEEKTETATNTAPTKSAEEELKELKASLAKANALVSKANSEAADWKRKYTSTLDEAKAAALKAEEQRKAELEELEQLRAEKRVSTYAKRLLESGYDAKTAELMAKVLPDGVGDEFFAANKTFIDTQRLKNQPGLSVGLPPTTEDAAKDRQNQLRRYAGLPPLP